MVVYNGRSMVYLILSFVSHVTSAMEDLKCPDTCPLEIPELCVRVKEYNGKGTYRSMSMCEFEQVRCRQDVQTMIVPFKFCFESSKEEKKTSEVIKPTRTQQLGNMNSEVKRHKRSVDDRELRKPESGKKAYKTWTLKNKPTRTLKLENL